MGQKKSLCLPNNGSRPSRGAVAFQARVGFAVTKNQQHLSIAHDSADSVLLA